MRSLRSFLDRIEFVDLEFHYGLHVPRSLPPFAELLLRPLLHRAGLERLDPASFERLFTPPLPDDPTALRRYQRPAPPFALQPRPRRETAAESVQKGSIRCHLFGDGIALLDDLITTMRTIAPFGDGHGLRDGRLVEVTARDAAGTIATLWTEGMQHCAAPPRIAASWRCEAFPAATDWQLEFIAPARLMVRNKPLFRPAFRHILPFILRRVTAMGYNWSAVEIEVAAELLLLAEELQGETPDLHWQDWRSLAAEEGSAELGGVTGTLLLRGPLPDELLLLLQAGSLLNIGKGAAYGAGAYRLGAT